MKRGTGEAVSVLVTCARFSTKPTVISAQCVSVEEVASQEAPTTSKRTRDSIVEAAKRPGQNKGGTLSRTEFERVTGIGNYHIYRLFPEGGWSEVLDLAGLARHPEQHERVSDDALLAEYHRAATSHGEIPSWHKFASCAKFSADVYRRRFGGIQGTLKRYRAWLEEHEPGSPLLAAIAAKSRHEVPLPPKPASAAGAIPSAVGEWDKTADIEYGAPMDFRGLRHAPLNEQGVVYLFGMVSYELGFLIEAVHASFPDCEAKRCIDRTRNRWQRVRIEFEYRSSQFRDHGHDPKRVRPDRVLGARLG
jgi:hypothetical protein